MLQTVPWTRERKSMEAVRVLMQCNSFLKTPIKVLITGFRYVKLISSDGHEFMVARDHALTSGTIKVIASHSYVG